MSDSVQIIVSDSTLGDTVSVISQPENTGISVLENSAPIPSGGLTGQALTKNSNTPYDLIWQTIVANIADGDKGDIVVSSSGSVWTIEAGAVSLSKMAALPTLTLIGNNTGGSATPLALTMSQVKTMLGLTASDISGLAAVATSGSASDLSSGTLPAARFNDTSHGNRAGGSLHADVVAAGASGFMTGADKTKLDAITGTNTGDQTITLTGPVTGSGTGSFATSITALAITGAMIADDAVGNDKLANMAVGTIKARIAAGTGNPQNATGTEVTALLDTFTDSLKGLAPASGGGTTNFLRADGTWAAPPAGDVVGPGSATDNALARFDTTTGKLIQNSNATLSDAGELVVNGTIKSQNSGKTIEMYHNGVNRGFIESAEQIAIITPDLLLGSTTRHLTLQYSDLNFTNGTLFHDDTYFNIGTDDYGANNTYVRIQPAGAITYVVGQLDVSGILTLPASTTSRASLRVPHGSAPTTPTDGDIWTTTTGLFARINGATVGPLGTGGGGGGMTTGLSIALAQNAYIS